MLLFAAMDASIISSEERGDVGLVVIARNEGERLKACIRSIADRAEYPMVYVDSGSTDGSVEWVRARGYVVVSLDMSLPFSAARARNAGFERLRELNPQVNLVQFVDGDCVLASGWLPVAANALRADSSLVVVCGGLLERFPEASIYNRIAEIGWESPPGETLSCGGIFMVRASAFAAAGGFDPSVFAGEEPELCGRLRERGGRVYRLPHIMASHDAAMFTFRQWWTRQLRSGRFDMDIAHRFHTAPMQRYRRQVHVARFWGVGVPLLAVVLSWVANRALGPWAAFATLLACLGIFPLQVVRIAQRINRGGRPWGVSFAYGTLALIGKWGHLVGQAGYVRDRVRGRGATLIEYRKGRPVDRSTGGREHEASP